MFDHLRSSEVHIAVVREASFEENAEKNEKYSKKNYQEKNVTKNKKKAKATK
jgi:hypothetical protein